MNDWGDQTETILILSGIALIFIGIYIVLPRITKKENTSLIVKGLLFGAVILYFAVHFFLKGDYIMLLPLGMGSWAFYKMVFDRYEKD